MRTNAIRAVNLKTTQPPHKLPAAPSLPIKQFAIMPPAPDWDGVGDPDMIVLDHDGKLWRRFYDRPMGDGEGGKTFWEPLTAENAK